MIKKKIIRKKQISTNQTEQSEELDVLRHHKATKSVQEWYKEHADTSVYSKKFSHKFEQAKKQED